MDRYRLGERILAYRMSAPMQGEDVAELQSRLAGLGFYNGLVEGHFGEVTHNALCSFQCEYGLSQDGICGPNTLRPLQHLGTPVTGGSQYAAHSDDGHRWFGSRAIAKRVVIDPGFGVADEYVDAATADLETRVLLELARLVEGRMAAAGIEIILTRDAADNPDDAVRAGVVNSYGPDLFIALRCGRYRNTNANGIATFYFGDAHGSASTIGRVLAGLVQQEVVARTGLKDCHTHQRTWDILRLAQMPTVEIDVGYITNPADAAALAEPQTRDVIADAILVAVKRLYLLGQSGNTPET
ncbi:N-acetylmuramoyl-L-alanine amidase [Williamsia maris]|uniref:N-acetylmuramoyl-L-alanine amidase n=1 Tax=Williamsia maris TaxID=72806 RepID=A0ABT1HIY6_9NOCA|nr:N-acetylmuramoyl-L-alanine amidase [Williamsia maris]MCP2177889.1 N-acetylmuramoyl-L-alanine amidase [Williamsia maris]